jgi:hypothetical protein
MGCSEGAYVRQCGLVGREKIGGGARDQNHRAGDRWSDARCVATSLGEQCR